MTCLTVLFLTAVVVVVQAVLSVTPTINCHHFALVESASSRSAAVHHPMYIHSRMYASVHAETYQESTLLPLFFDDKDHTVYGARRRLGAARLPYNWENSSMPQMTMTLRDLLFRVLCPYAH